MCSGRSRKSRNDYIYHELDYIENLIIPDIADWPNLIILLLWVVSSKNNDKRSDAPNTPRWEQDATRDP